MRNYRLIALAILYTPFYLSAQKIGDTKFGTITAANFVVNSPIVDSNANAVILEDIGSSYFEGNNKGRFSLIFKRIRRIKILSKNGFDAADVQILLYTDGEGKEKLEDCKGITYNLESNNVVSTKLDPKSIFTEKTKTYTWFLNNAKAIVFEPFQPSFAEIATSVLLAPSQFELAGYKGNMETWGNLGKFISVLNSGRDILPENLKKEVHTLTDNLPSVEAKMEALYSYLQKNTRYIGIQLGIGGWQPLEAAFVADKKYGDCKALSNFMQSLLKEAGIKSNYVLITAGKGEQGLSEGFRCAFF